LKNPRKVLHRGDSWVFGPEEPYEQTGDVGGVVFPCGWVVAETGGEVRMYYGAADTSIGVATAKLDDLLNFVLASPKPPVSPKI
jgi:predicted GH43/DUF377 family glycosyl hydrolase